jgi:hypothetical protein
VNGNHTLTKDVLISDHQSWQKIHWRSIETAYNNSPFFLYYQDQIARYYEKKYRFLLDLNTELLQTLLQLINSPRPVKLTEHYEKPTAKTKDLRATLGAKYPGTHIEYPHYTQVFESRHGFIPGLSFLDVIFNLGPEASYYLDTIK